MRYEVNGQEDVSLVVGAPGNKTLTIAVAGSHVNLQNHEPRQPVMFSIVAAPVFPNDWQMLAPEASIVIDMAGGAALYLRKKRWLRYVDPSARIAPAGSDFVGGDVTASVDVTERTY
jgi:hypothetical protein